MGIPKVYFDTLTVTENLITAGMPDAQAKAIAKEYAHLMQHHVDQFATKEDIKLLRNELQRDIQHVRSELQRDLQHVEERLNTKIDTQGHQLNTKIDTKFNELDAKIDSMLLRFIVCMGGMIATAAGLIIGAMKFLIA